jgi:hypothetical protein
MMRSANPASIRFIIVEGCGDLREFSNHGRQ